MIKLHISVPDIDLRLQQGFDFIRVFRGPTSSGPFTEVTSEGGAPARIVGAVQGPFYDLPGKTIDLVVNNGPTQSVVLSVMSPATAQQVADVINTDAEGVIAADNGNGYLQITTTGSGTDELIRVISGSAIAALGFAPMQQDIGEALRIPLVTDVSSYTFVDHNGTTQDYYVVDFYNATTGSASLTSDPLQGVPAQGQTAENVPKQQAEARSPRGLTLLRGASHVFREAFFADDGVTPLVPLDSSRYPAYQVIDITGQVLAAGLATLDGNPGNYRVELFVPKDAPLSNEDVRYRLEWVFVDDVNRQYEKTTEFDVRDADVTATQLRDQKFIAMCGQPFRVFIRELKRPYALRLDVTNSGNQTAVQENVIYPGTGDPSETTLTEVIDGETFIYYFDLPPTAFQPGFTYQAIWSITETLGTAQQFAFQIIEVPPPTTLQHFASLRMAIDKYQKKREIIQAYQDSDIYEYLQRGRDILNGWHPVTHYQFAGIPQPLAPFWLLCSQMWALNAQHLLEVDLSFDFSGQTVTLNYDHTAGLEAGYQRALDFLNERLTPAKMAFYRRAVGVGSFAGKPYRYSAIHNFTFPIAKFGSQDFLTLLSNIGLL